MRAALIAAVALSFAACVTPGDVREIAYSLEEVEKVVLDEKATAAELGEAIEDARNEVEVVAKRVEERTEGAIEGIGQGAEGGIIGIGAALAMHLYRNRTRKRDLERAVARKRAS
jgi:hypothetical protein